MIDRRAGQARGLAQCDSEWALADVLFVLLQSNTSRGSWNKRKGLKIRVHSTFDHSGDFCFKDGVTNRFFWLKNLFRAASKKTDL